MNAGDLPLAVVTQAHLDLRDIYVAAITAARNFSNRGKSDQSAEAMGLARDATRVRQALTDAAANSNHTEVPQWI